MLTRVFVLGLLTFRPMSGYAIQHYLRLNRADHWAVILPGSIHYALKKLATEGFVTLQTTEQTGYRTKAIYAITDAGRHEFHRLLEQLWSTPEQHSPIGLYAALTFLNALPMGASTWRSICGFFARCGSNFRCCRNFVHRCPLLRRSRNAEETLSSLSSR